MYSCLYTDLNWNRHYKLKGWHLYQMSNKTHPTLTSVIFLGKPGTKRVEINVGWINTNSFTVLVFFLSSFQPFFFSFLVCTFGQPTDYSRGLETERFWSFIFNFGLRVTDRLERRKIFEVKTDVYHLKSLKNFHELQ